MYAVSVTLTDPNHMNHRRRNWGWRGAKKKLNTAGKKSVEKINFAHELHDTPYKVVLYYILVDCAKHVRPLSSPPPPSIALSHAHVFGQHSGNTAHNTHRTDI